MSNALFGVKGFEPLNDRTKNDCLTIWLYPIPVKVIKF
jgi:hypothetical protein